MTIKNDIHQEFHDISKKRVLIIEIIGVENAPYAFWKVLR